MLTEQSPIGKQTDGKHGDAHYWAIVLIWAGIVFGAESLGVLPQIGGADAWNWVFFGTGVLALFGCIRRATLPNRIAPTMWDYVWAAILIILGLSGLTAVEISFPLILLVIGFALLSGTVLRSEGSPT